VWTWLAERASGTRASPATLDALEASRGRGAWWSRLAAWALADGTGSPLGTVARDDLERAEATFYEAARDGRVDALRALSASPWIELFEVQLAQERAQPWRRGPAPSDARWPWDAPPERR
jgi:hypothetical protein